MNSRLNELMDRRDALTVILANYNAMVSLCEESQNAIIHEKNMAQDDREELNKDLIKVVLRLKENVENVADMLRENNNDIKKLFEEKKEE